MAETTIATALEKQKWINAYFAEYVRESGFAGYMGKAATSIIVAKMDLQEEAGKTINIPLITRLKGAGVTGNGTLDGNEEALGSYNCAISIDWRRNAVRVPKSTSYKTEIDLLNAARDMLKMWEAEQIKTDIIKALASVVTTADTTVNLDASAAADRNAFAAANADRILFGSAVSNYSATFATGLLNVDTTADKCTASMMSLAKRMAKLADPHIRPYKSSVGQEYFVAFHGSRTFRDLKADPVMTQANRDARPRDVENNPLFQDGDLIYDGVLHREVPEIDSAPGIGSGTFNLNGQGAAACDVRPVFLCGQQSVGVAWGQQPTPRTDNLKDYQFRPGVAIEELLGVKKLAFNGKPQGIVTVYAAAAADS
jgi:N4-gp56 family major capsid protein